MRGVGLTTGRILRAAGLRALRIGSATAPVETGPNLSNPVDSAAGTDGATLSVTIDKPGTVAFVVTSSATQPSVQQVETGQDHTGAAAEAVASVAAQAAGSVAVSVSGLLPSWDGWMHAVARNAAGVSSVVSGDGFRTAAAPQSTSLQSVFDQRPGGPNPRGATAATKMPVATWVAQTSGASMSGDLVSVSGNDVTMSNVDLGSARVRWTGANGVIDDVVSVGAPPPASGEAGLIRMYGTNPTVRRLTVNNFDTAGRQEFVVFNKSLTGDSGTCIVEECAFLWGMEDFIKAPNNGLMIVRDCLLWGGNIQALVHLDFIDMKACSPGSRIERTLIVAEAHPSSIGSGGGTGFVNAVRCNPGDTHGYNGTGRTYRECIFIGSADPSTNAQWLYVGGTAGVQDNDFDDCLINRRNHTATLAPGHQGIENWDVRTVDWDASLSSGTIQPGGHLPYDQLASDPATVPFAPVAPVLTGGGGVFTWAAFARAWNGRDPIQRYDLRHSTDGATWTTVQDIARTGGSLSVAAGANYRVQVRAVNGVGAGAWSPSSNLVTVFAASTNLQIFDFALDAWPYDEGRVMGRNSADVPVRAMADPGAVVEFRGEGLTGAWMALTADGGGNVAGYVPTAPDPTPRRMVARLRDNPSVTDTTANRYRTGHVAMTVSQSILNRVFSTVGAQDSAAHPHVPDVSNLIVRRTDDGTAPVTVRVDNTATPSGAEKAFAVAMAEFAPGQAFALVDASVSGTSPFALVDDGNASRLWSTLENDAVGWVRDPNGIDGRISLMLWHWFNEPHTVRAAWLQNFSPMLFGQYIGGATFPLGGANDNTVPAAACSVDHFFWDFDALASQRGRGLFARDECRGLWLRPHMLITAEDLLDPITKAAGTVAAQSRNFGEINATGLPAFMADGRAQQVFTALGPRPLMAKPQNDASHPDGSTVRGTQWLAGQVAAALARALGFISFANPHVSGHVIGAGGAHVDLVVNLGGGGTLTTLRAKDGLPGIGTSQPHYSTVMGGWRGVGTASREPLAGNIVQATGANARIRLTRPGNAAFQNGDVIDFLPGGSPYISWPEDVQNDVFASMPIVDFGWQSVPGLGFDGGWTVALSGIS